MKNIKNITTITLIGTMLGLFYPLIGDAPGDIRALINGLIIGTFGGLAVGILEILVFGHRRGRGTFVVHVVLKTLLYVVIFATLIVTVKGLVDSSFKRVPFASYVSGEEFQHFLIAEDFHIILAYCFFLLLAIIFTRQMSLRMGQGVLLDFITGKYHHPKETERIFMYVDLCDSTHLAETLGDIQYHRLFNQFVGDVTKCIIRVRGRIYRYVGDQIVVTWVPGPAAKNGKCIHAFHDIIQELRRQSDRYYRHFGVVPTFKTAAHIGKVIIGEIGDVKSQISYHGDTMYFTALMEKKCRTLQKPFIISGDLYSRLSADDKSLFEAIGVLDTGDETPGKLLYSIKYFVNPFSQADKTSSRIDTASQRPQYL